MIQVPAGPFLPEVLLHERGAFLIDGPHQLDGFRFGFAEIAHPPDLLFGWRVHEHVKGVGTAAQHVRCPSAHNHAIARGSRPFDHSLHEDHHAVRIQMLQAVHRQAPFVAAAHEHLHQPVE